LHLHIDGAGLDALERDRCDPLDHARPCSGANLAQATALGKNNSGTNRLVKLDGPVQTLTVASI
jgi:hypothetical protein